MSVEKKIIIDEDWKSQVEAEQEAAKQAEVASDSATAEGVETVAAGKVAETAADAVAADPSAAKEPSATASEETPVAAGTEEAAEDPPMPPASIGMLMSSLATEALISMGQFPHPATGETILRKNQAKYLVDTLEMLKEKTKGNLTSEEDTALSDVLHQLRMAFIQIV